MKIGSLFAGYGGLELAIQKVIPDAHPAWFVEFDAAPSKVLAHHYPDIPNYGDVTKVDWSQVEPIDILAGGSPCQDLSLAGARKGMTDGTRSNLWVNMRQAIEQLHPRLVVWENVLGALSAKATSNSDMEPGQGLLGNAAGGHLRALGRVLGDLAEIGYDARWTTIRASDVGAPHHRARVFLIAYPALSDTGSIRRERGQGGQARGRVSPLRDETISATDRPAENATHPNDTDAGRFALAEETQQPRAGRSGSSFSHAESQRRDHGKTTNQRPADREINLPGHHCDAAADTQEQRLAGQQQPIGEQSAQPRVDGSGHVLSNTNSVRQYRRGTTPHQAPGTPPTAHRHSSGIEWGQYAPAVRRWEIVTGTPAPAPTEPNSKGNPRLSAAFTEWLMGLPAGWVTDVPGLTRAQQLKMLGNGVVPLQAATAIKELLEVACGESIHAAA